MQLVRLPHRYARQRLALQQRADFQCSHISEFWSKYKSTWMIFVERLEIRLKKVDTVKILITYIYSNFDSDNIDT